MPLAITFIAAIVFFAFLVLATVQPLLAQAEGSASPPRVTIPDTEIHEIYSEAVGDTFELWIAHPQKGFMPVQEEKPRVLYILDANLFFGTAVEMTRIMHKLFGELPPLTIVGIAYQTDSGFLQGKLRTRDFTPSKDERMAQRAASFPQMPETPKVDPSMGGANAFLRFIEEEVKPFIHTHYNVQRDDTTLFGSSLGGLFAAHTLLTAPTSFTNYIVVSPALWWNDSEIFEVLRRFSFPVNDRVHAFIAAGSLEESPDIPGVASYKLVTNAQKLHAELDAKRDAKHTVHFEKIDGETHTSVVPVALTRGLRHILRPLQPRE